MYQIKPLIAAAVEQVLKAKIAVHAAAKGISESKLIREVLEAELYSVDADDKIG